MPQESMAHAISGAKVVNCRGRRIVAPLKPRGVSFVCEFGLAVRGRSAAPRVGLCWCTRFLCERCVRVTRICFFCVNVV